MEDLSSLFGILIFRTRFCTSRDSRWTQRLWKQVSLNDLSSYFSRKESIYKFIFITKYVNIAQVSDVTIGIDGCLSIGSTGSYYKSKDKIFRNIDDSITRTQLSQFIDACDSFSSFARSINKTFMEKWDCRWFGWILGYGRHLFFWKWYKFIRRRNIHKTGIFIGTRKFCVKSNSKFSQSEEMCNLHTCSLLLIEPISNIRPEILIFKSRSFCVYNLYFFWSSFYDKLHCSEIDMFPQRSINMVHSLKSYKIKPSVWREGFDAIIFLRSKSSRSREKKEC
jgi:hypothetical protein